MSMKMNKAEFMFGDKAGELQSKLEEETGVKWDVKRTCEGCAYDYLNRSKEPCYSCTRINYNDCYEVVSE